MLLSRIWYFKLTYVKSLQISINRFYKFDYDWSGQRMYEYAH